MLMLFKPDRRKGSQKFMAYILIGDQCPTSFLILVGIVYTLVFISDPFTGQEKTIKLSNILEICILFFKHIMLTHLCNIHVL